MEMENSDFLIGSRLENIVLNMVVCRGYSFQIEMNYKTFKLGLRITEIPIIFPDRKI